MPEVTTTEERGMQISVEKLLGKVCMSAQQAKAPDEVIEQALLNVLCFALCHQYDTNDKAIAFLTQQIPHAMRDARMLYDSAQAKKGG
jgi:hypothetical protein